MATVMEQSQISRMQFKHVEPSELQQSRVDLALQAQQELGYSRLAHAVAEPAESLAGALKKLAIAPLVEQDVEAYKKSKEWHGMWSGDKVRLAKLAAAILCAGTAVWPGYISEHTSGPLFGAVCLFGAVMFAVVAITTTIHALVEYEQGSRQQRVWRTYALSGYKGSVPEHVLSRALEIKREFPKVHLSIQQLVEEKREGVKRLVDPFLVAEHLEAKNENRENASIFTMNSFWFDVRQQEPPLERFYIDVWDEKEYERTL
jgi:hypothetical protein